MTFRKLVFWAHLCCGLTAGIVILMMSVTGVLLTYERQMIAWVDQAGFSNPVATGERHTVDSMLDSLNAYPTEGRISSLTIAVDPHALVSASAGRSEIIYLDPYTNRVIGEGNKVIRNFTGLMTQWHRWFNVSGDGRSIARMITGASNVIFLFLILSGMYLWLPKTFKWSLLKLRLLFSRDNPTSKARDFNWHHVFGIWSCIPLAVVVATAFVFSYPWVGNMVYTVFGEEPPVRGRPPAAVMPQESVDPEARGDNIAGSRAIEIIPVAARQSMSLNGYSAQSLKSAKTGPGLESLFHIAARQAENWKTITLQVPEEPLTKVMFIIDQGDGGQPQKQSRLTLDSQSGNVISHQTFSSQSSGRKARSIIRRLHTGEVIGIAGQTVAGLVSFAGIILVWTGIALAYRRLIQPLFRKKGTEKKS